MYGWLKRGSSESAVTNKAPRSSVFGLVIFTSSPPVAPSSPACGRELRPVLHSSSRPEERREKRTAAAGHPSRRKAEELILGGAVQVNGQTVTELGSKADAIQDHIRVSGKLLRPVDKHRYFMLNKPKGYVTTVSDPEKRPTVMEFFARGSIRVYPVGRLDYQS
jgi:hypothetical protein